MLLACYTLINTGKSYKTPQCFSLASFGCPAGTFIGMNVERDGFKSSTNEMNCPRVVNSSVSNMI